MILELEKQVCSLGLAKKIRKLGVEQDSLYGYYRWTNRVNAGVVNKLVVEEMMPFEGDYDTYEFVASAFTMPELLKIIGDRFLSINLYCSEASEWIADTKSHECDCDRCKKELKKDPNFFPVNWESEKAKTPIQTLAKLLIILLEKKLVITQK